jgi:hypothetical protein
MKHDIPFRAVTYATTWGIQTLNAYDVMTATAFCDKWGIQQEIHDIDYKGFLDREEHFEYAEKYRTTSPQIACHLFFLDQLKHKGTIHMGGDLPLMYINNNNEAKMKANSSLLLNVSMIYNRYATYTGTALVKDVLMSTPEIMYLAYQNNTETVKRFKIACHLADVYRQGMQRYKEAYYQPLGLDVSAPLVKYTGFEILKKHLASITGDYDEYDKRYRHPMEKYVSDKPDLKKVRTRIIGPDSELVREFEETVKTESPQMISEYVFDF